MVIAVPIDSVYNLIIAVPFFAIAGLLAIREVRRNNKTKKEVAQ